MIFWLLQVNSTVNVNGTDVAFDYLNTFYEMADAIKEAKLLSEDEDVLQVSVHGWKLNPDGTHEILDDERGCVFSYFNKNHREFS